MTKKLVVVIDTQYDFVMPKGKLYIDGAERIVVPGIEYLEQLSVADTAGVLFTFDTHDSATYFSMPESEQFPIHCEAGTAGWENVFSTKLINRDIPLHILHKGVFNMWEEDDIKIKTISSVSGLSITNREDFFTALKDAGITEIEMIGVAADFCVKWAIDGFIARDFKVTVVEKLTKGIAKEMNDVNVTELNGLVNII